MLKALDQTWRGIHGSALPVKLDREVSPGDIQERNLIVVGTPSTNQIYAEVASRLPIQVTPEKVTLGARSYSGIHLAVLAIYPNPLNPAKYIVIANPNTSGTWPAGYLDLDLATAWYDFAIWRIQDDAPVLV